MLPVTEVQAKRQGSSTVHGSSFACTWVADVSSWALKRVEPNLRETPVIVLAGRQVYGACEVARKAGVRPGDALDRARGLCPSAAIAQLEPSVLTAAWESALEVLNRVTPWLESPRVGIAYLTGVSKLEVEALASELELRVGLAASREAAWLAAVAALKNQARMVSDDAAFLVRVPVYLLRFVGVSTDLIHRLELFGLKTLGEVLLRTTGKSLEAQFGKAAKPLLAILNAGGSGPIAVFRPPASLKGVWTFDPPAVEPHEVEPILTPLLARTAKRLHGKFIGTLTISLETTLGSSSARQVLKQYTDNLKTLLMAAERLTRATITGIEIYRFEVLFSDLVYPTPFQDSLFGNLERPDVREVIKTVHQRFPEKIGRLVVTRPQAVLPEERFHFQSLNGEVPRSKKKKGGKA